MVQNTKAAEIRRRVMVGTFLPHDLHADVKRIAKSERRSIAAWLLVLIEKEIAKRRKAA